jgi:hypothetical protein
VQVMYIIETNTSQYTVDTNVVKSNYKLTHTITNGECKWRGRVLGHEGSTNWR